jgi:hypothetical protein
MLAPSHYCPRACDGQSGIPTLPNISADLGQLRQHHPVQHGLPARFAVFDFFFPFPAHWWLPLPRTQVPDNGDAQDRVRQAPMPAAAR